MNTSEKSEIIYLSNDDKIREKENATKFLKICIRLLAN